LDYRIGFAGHEQCSGSEGCRSFQSLANLGFNWCPGCGLGRSLSHLLHGELRQSIQMHWFGIPALLVLLYRIFILSKQELIKRNLIGKEKYYV
jgi:hypothetical protein